jgi:hypothetical protein
MFHCSDKSGGIPDTVPHVERARGERARLRLNPYNGPMAPRVSSFAYGRGLVAAVRTT